VRDLEFSHAKFVKRIGALLCAVVAAGAGTSAASPVRPASYEPARAWGGAEIRSLDPTRLASAASKGTDRHRDQVLSNETTFTRWAYVNRVAWIHRLPRTSSKRVGRLTWYTPDGFPSVYLLLRTRWDTRGREWVNLRIPGRPNGRTGWVTRSALSPFHLNHLLLVVNREQMRMYFFSRGHRIWSAPVGVGKPSTPTPAGHFWIDERFTIANPSSGYYPYAFGTTDYSTLTEWPHGGVVGIHGPYYDPQGIPGQISHGCIRLEIADDFWLAAHMKLGTPVHVI
jgi:hypothetical protein